jgi:hypothetical protein
MAFLRSHTGNLSIENKKEEVLSTKIAELERIIDEAPEKLQERLERERTMMPPPDDLADRERERKFYAELSRGELQNERRYRARSTVLFTLSVAATLSVCWWIYAELQRSGILSF